MINPDSTFIELADSIIKKYGFKRDARQAFVMSHGIGDAYFFLSALPYVEKLLNKDYFIIARKNSPPEDLLRLFAASGQPYKIIPDTEGFCDLFNKISGDTQKQYAGLFDRHISPGRHPLLNSVITRPDVRANLVRPRYECLECDPGIHYSIEPGRTILLIPESIWHGSPGDHFWKSVIEMYRLLGFKILVNSQRTGKYGTDVEYIWPPASSLVPIADKCGFVFSVRTGGSEIIAAESSAHIIMVNYYLPLERIYPFIPPDKISYVSINNIRECGFRHIEDYYMRMISSNNKNAYLARDLLAAIDRNIIPAEQQYDGHAQKNAIFAPRRRDFNIMARFCDISYSIAAKDGYVFLRLVLDPPLEYEIHGALLDAATGLHCGEITYCVHNPLAFQVDRNGVYRIFVKIYHPITNYFCYFTTRRFEIRLDLALQLQRCRDLEAYVGLLKEHSSELIVFLVSRDCHTNAAMDKDIFIQNLGLKMDPGSKYAWSYAAVIDGRVIFEDARESEKILHEYKWDGHRATMISAGYSATHDNQAPISIKIDGTEAAVNWIGLNFVIWSKSLAKVIDSVCFDSFREGNKAFRLNKAFSRQPD